jgi:hypothetical protein
MSAMQQPTPNHQSETFGSGQTQFFKCEVLSADHPGDSGPRARPKTVLATLQSNREAGPTCIGSRMF